jgi:stress-induced morphogen
MPITREELEAVIRAAIPVTKVNVEDNSGGCGEKYSVLIVSKVPSNPTVSLTPMTRRWMIF